MQALKIAATGMEAQQRRVEVISNNLANMSTTAYNARRAEFTDLHYQQLRPAGAISASDGSIMPTGTELGLGVRLSAVSMDVQQGPVKSTGGDLDLVIEGRGYFEVTLPSGDSAYTRDGAFKRTGDGEIVTTDGYPLVPGFTIPEDARSISINASGEIYAYFDGQVEPELLGAIPVVLFSNESGLEPMGDNIYRETEGSGPAQVDDAGVDGRGAIRQGYLEESSVDPVKEITDLIEAQRGYELNSKVISAADEMLGAVTRVR